MHLLFCEASIPITVLFLYAFQLASMSENEHFQNIKKINSWLTKGRLRSLRLKTDRTRQANILLNSYCRNR